MGRERELRRHSHAVDPNPPWPALGLPSRFAEQGGRAPDTGAGAGPVPTSPQGKDEAPFMILVHAALPRVAVRNLSDSGAPSATPERTRTVAAIPTMLYSTQEGPRRGREIAARAQI